ncbi:hypothetical protein [Mycolicibacterium sp. XJ652]
MRAYDPDYVVTLPINLGDLDAVRPGEIDAQIEKLRADGAVIDDIESLRSQLRGQPVSFEDDARARESVVAACSTYRMALGDDADISNWNERIASLHPNDVGLGPLTPVHLIKPDASPRFGARSDLNTPIGLMAASYVGLVENPTTAIADIDPKHVEDFVASITGRRSDTRIRPQWSCFEQVDVEEGAEEARVAWTDSQIELTWVSDSRHNPVLYVVGNEPEDYCLALIWERLYGQSIWVPNELWVDETTTSTSQHRQWLTQGMIDLTRSPGAESCLLTSVSGDLQLVGNFQRVVFETPPIVRMFDMSGNPDPNSVRPRADRVENVDSAMLRFPDRGRGFLGLRRHFQRSDTMPIVRDAEGGATLASPRPASVLDAPGLGGAKVSFHIDLDIRDVTMPQGRAIPPAALIHPSENHLDRYEAWVRSGRQGVSYESLRYGLVLAGTLPEEALARPRVRKPGMLSWARWKSQMSGYELQVADAGWPAQILAEKCGSRQVLVDLFSGPLRMALLEFKTYPSGKSTISVFKNGEGCVINRQTYLAMRGFELFTGLPLAEVRILVDQLLVAGVLTRGLLLRCSICRVFSFHDLDAVGQSNRCPRCGNVDSLTQERWNVPAGEPGWFYHLHPLARDLVRDDGDVPLLLAAYLRKRAGKRYADTPEVVVVQGGKTAAEADLVAVTDGVLIVGEAKSNNTLGVDKANEVKSVGLRLHLAEIFGADEILIATTESAWKERSLTAIKAAMESYTWPGGLRPRLRAVTSLGADGKGVETYLR